jgi:hypothetical protein
VPDILVQLRGVKPEVLERALCFELAGERWIDCSGPRHEFLTVGGQQIISPHYDMFQIIRDPSCWFTVNSLEALETCTSLGPLVGLARFNQNCLPVRFSELLYKKLLHIPLRVADAAELNEEIAPNKQPNLLQSRRGEWHRRSWPGRSLRWSKPIAIMETMQMVGQRRIYCVISCFVAHTRRMTPASRRTRLHIPICRMGFHWQDEHIQGLQEF